MERKRQKTGTGSGKDYGLNYLDLPFENILREYRKNNILKLINKKSHRRFLEIGCGPEPMFRTFSDFDRMTIVEPGKLFYDMAKKEAETDPRIIIFNNQIENITGILNKDNFDFIVIGGFLHEIKNPEAVLNSVRKISSKETHIYSFVPNARSFHRLLALEMGITSSIYQKSEHDQLFERQNVFDINGFNDLLSRNGFLILESGSYFIKPFTHDQMDKLLRFGIIDKSCLSGLDKMIKFLPDLGAELWNICTIDDKIS